VACARLGRDGHNGCRWLGGGLGKDAEVKTTETLAFTRIGNEHSIEVRYLFDGSRSVVLFGNPGNADTMAVIGVGQTKADAIHDAIGQLSHAASALRIVSTRLVTERFNRA